MPSAMGGGSFEPKVITSGALGGQNMVPPPPTPALAVPRIIPVEPLPGRGQVVGSARPKLIQLQRDTTGLVPARPPGPTLLPPPNSEVAKDVDRMLILPIREPEGEIAIVAGQSRIVQTKKTLTQVVMANPTIADVELLANRPEGHVLNVSGKSYGDTTMTLWDEDNQPVSFLIRVSMDTKDLEVTNQPGFPWSAGQGPPGGLAAHPRRPGARFQDDVRRHTACHGHGPHEPFFAIVERWGRSHGRYGWWWNDRGRR